MSARAGSGTRGPGGGSGVVLLLVLASAVLGHGASLLALLAGPARGPLADAAAAFLVLAPLPIGPALLGRRTDARTRGWLALAVAAVQVALVLRVWSPHDGTWLAALLCAAQGHALSRSPQAGASVLSLALAAAQTSAALRVASSDVVLLFLLLQLALAACALVLLHLGAARQLAARNARLAAQLERRPVEVRGRLAFALRLSALLLVPALALLGLGTRVADVDWWHELDPTTRRPPAPEGVDELPGDAARTAPGGATVWSDGVQLGGGVGRLSDEVVLWARPRDALEGRVVRDLAALRLTVLPLDTFGADGLGNPHLGRYRELEDADDGRNDGWVRAGPRPRGEELLLEVVQKPLRVATTVGEALVRSQPLHALEAPRALYSPDGVLMLPSTRDDWFAYRQLCGWPGGLPPAGEAAAARHPDPRFVQLPDDGPSLRALADRASRLVRGARTDAERVRRVVEHFARGYAYSLEGGGFAGVRGVLDFLDRREGYCTYFAAATVLLLRTQGLACRAVGGYLAHEWDDERGAFVVRGRNAHAWVEVHFEGRGWCSVDPTPARQRELAFERADDPAPAGFAAWSAGLVDAVRDAALNDGPGAALARVGAVLSEAPTALRTSVERRPWVAGAALLVVLLALCLAVPRRVRAALRAVGLRGGDEPPGASFYGRLLAALARLGVRPRGSETPREFGLRVALLGGGELRDVARATELFYRMRYGGEPLAADERAFLDELLADLRSRARRKDRGTIAAGA